MRPQIFAAPVTASIGNQEMEFVVNVEHMQGTNIAVLAPYDFTRFTMKSNRSEAAPIFLAFRRQGILRSGQRSLGQTPKEAIRDA